MFLKIGGKLHYLWRAVDQHGVVLDILVQDRRNGIVNTFCLETKIRNESSP